MSDSRLLYDAFNIYYEKGMDALRNNNYEVAKRNIFSAAESLLKLAKTSQGPLKSSRLKRASELTDLANKIALKQQKKLSTSSNNEIKDSEDKFSNVEVKVNDKVSLSEALKELNDLTGLESVKNQINDWVEQIKVFEMRKKANLSIPPMSYHLIFTGNPGTGKTTIARIIAKIYCALNITKTAKFVEVDRADLVGGYIGHTAIKTKEVIAKAEGGVLFIDEAYTLANKGDNDFGQEAIDTLLKEMEDNRDNLIVIAAGYDNLMEGFVNSNPGLKSRFKTFIKFDDYSPSELNDIFMGFCKQEQYELDSKAASLLKKLIYNMYSNRTDKFGNGREMRNLFESIVTNQSKRVAKLVNPSRNELMKILEEDLPINDEKKTDLIDNSKEESSLSNNQASYNDYKFDWDSLPSITFDDVAGLDDVKEEVKVKVLLPLKHPEALHGYLKKNGGGLLLYGPPGTGKTMIAAAIANEIKAKFCSVKPSDLLHSGAGNSEKAVRSLFAQARQYPCSIIYFDEMDSIAQKDTRSTYSKQLRSELLSQLQGIESYGKETGNILYLIAATNKPWDMDSAFIRPGRFGTRVYVGLPDEKARKYMVEDRLNKIKEKNIVDVNDDINIDNIISLTNGFNGSDMSNLLDKVEEISIVRGIKENSKYINNDDFIKALETIKSTVQKADIERLSIWNEENNI